MHKIVLHDGREIWADAIGLRPATLFYTDAQGARQAVDMDLVRQLFFDRAIAPVNGEPPPAEGEDPMRAPVAGDIVKLAINPEG